MDGERSVGEEDTMRAVKKEDHRRDSTKLPSPQLNTFPAQCRNSQHDFQPGREDVELCLKLAVLTIVRASPEETCGKNSCVSLEQLILLEKKKLHNINVFSLIPSSLII